jgi:hypothetical protein
MIKIKDNFKELLMQSLDKDLIDFWNIKLAKGGVVRTDAKTNNIKAIYLSITTFDYNLEMEWLKFIPRTETGKQSFFIDSIYSKRNLYGDPTEDEYRYTADKNRNLLATYKYLGKSIVGDAIVSQRKNGVESSYICGTISTLPDSIKKFEGVDLREGDQTVFWTDSDQDRHWSFLECPLNITYSSDGRVGIISSDLHLPF